MIDRQADIDNDMTQDRHDVKPTTAKATNYAAFAASAIHHSSHAHDTQIDHSTLLSKLDSLPSRTTK